MRNKQIIRLQFFIKDYIPNAGIKQWPDQGNNSIFTKNQDSPTEPVTTKTNREEKKKGEEKGFILQVNQQACLPAIQITTKVLYQEHPNITFSLATNLPTALSRFSKLNELEICQNLLKKPPSTRSKQRF